MGWNIHKWNVLDIRIDLFLYDLAWHTPKEYKAFRNHVEDYLCVKVMT